MRTRKPSREIDMSERLTKDDWIAACEAAEAEWIEDGNDPNNATLYVMVPAVREVPKELRLGLSRLPGVRRDVSTTDIEVCSHDVWLADDVQGYDVVAYPFAAHIRWALQSPRFDFEINRYVPLR